MNNTSRREFLKLLGTLSTAGIAAPLAVNLAAISNVAAATATDYKALICIFLFGGNDQNNTIIPVDNAHYNRYVNTRPDIAFPQAQLLNTAFSPLNSLPDNSLQLALNPAMRKMKTLFDEQRLAMLFNVGPLVQPTTLEQYKNKSAPLPPKLFSHNDQQSIWQSSEAEGAVQGWGGALGDLALQGNEYSSFTNISLRGNSVFLSGQQTQQYQLSSNGAIPIYGAREGNYIYGSKTCGEIFHQLLTQASNNPVENAYKAIINRSINNEKLVAEAMENLPNDQLTIIDNLFPADNDLARQLQMVTKMIAAQSEFSDVKRQIFMVGLGGFDSHDNLLTNHTSQLELLSEAMFAFQRATESLGVSEQITSFTASEFGRTFTSNGNGSDHGWGGHHFIMGGAVNGGRTYGDIPEYALNTNVDVGRGRLLPTTSLASYIATLANWFGIAASDLPYVIPTINNFDQPLLDFI